MKHLFGRVYFVAPFIGIKLYNKAAVIIGNIVIVLITAGIAWLIIKGLLAWMSNSIRI